MPLEDLLAGCLRLVAGNGPDDGARADPELAEAQRAFLAAGLGALATPADERRWVQVGLSPATRDRAPLEGELLDFTRRLLAGGAATGFFFMHKSPGLRVRFQAPPGGREALRERVLRWADGLAAGGVTTTVVPAVYEAEAGLFGGRVSVRHAHELFTADSLAWLEVRRRGGVPTWVVSLAMVRAVLDGLSVVGWEDRDVWDRVRSEAGRRLPEGARGQTGLDAAVRGLRALWQDQDRLTASLPEWARHVVAEHRERALDIGARWRAEVFDGHDTGAGPRHAAAFHVVFHWNRGALPAERQVLLAEALGTPEGETGSGDGGARLPQGTPAGEADRG
ncbi:thiopeptide-type bacteriocin biosynthesis protein [Saccharothrix lopnurensis]|uniref:Thiopeptide-type bacteriocin biosynthesis protein n=1 Tax=Saccharothrix lopnurensis TaxID=1670621 RepID=A0ABW1NXL8_9PSEU